MRILLVHNTYQYYSGEDAVVNAEFELLARSGHVVEQWIEHSSSIELGRVLDRLRLATGAVWSRRSFREAVDRIGRFKPDVVHVHNTIPLISPSVYTACHRLRVPAVHTIHNFKLVCPGAFLFRAGQTCELCLSTSWPYPAIFYGCYRESRLQSTVAVAGLVVNRMLGTCSRHVTRYIALTDFARKKLVEAGLPGDRIDVKPNFAGVGVTAGAHRGGYALFAGKLEPLKGVRTLLEAWKQLDGTIPLKVVGRGSLEHVLRQSAPPGLTFLGAVSPERVVELMRDAALTILPSQWYEGFPMVIVESFATGTPVLASRLGAMAEIVKEGETGWLFNAGDAAALAKAVRDAWRNPEEIRNRGRRARKQYEAQFSPEKSHERLMEIYAKAIRQTAND